MKILVTGGTGYIGSHTTIELQAAGHEVIAIDNFSNSYKWVLDSIEKVSGVKPAFEEIDLSNKESLTDFFTRNTDIDGVIHFAAFKAVGESVKKPLMYYQNNVSATVNLLECLNKFNIPNLVFSSSCTVYGQPDELPVHEGSTLQTNSPYGRSKLICENIIQDTVEVTSLQSIALRYFNPIGAHESTELGELPIGPPNCLVPYLMQTAIGKRECLSVFGDDYNTVDGTGVRDYIHVVDIAKAHVIAVERMLANKQESDFEYFNLGTGNGYSVLETIQSFEKISGEKLNYKIEPRRSGDVAEVWADTTKANKVLGWKAKRDLDTMVSSAWEWEKALKERGL